MNRALKKRFRPFLTEKDLRSAIELVCAKFGRLTKLKILPASREPNLGCACLLRLDSAAAEAALKTEFDIFDFDGDLAFFAEVDERWTGPTM
ncbi:MAG: hypothetical protein V1796_03270 [Pseudomonadota bacterium]